MLNQLKVVQKHDCALTNFTSLQPERGLQILPHMALPQPIRAVRLLRAILPGPRVIRSARRALGNELLQQRPDVRRGDVAWHRIDVHNGVLPTVQRRGVAQRRARALDAQRGVRELG